MIKADVRNLEGKKVDEIELDEKVFGLECNDALINQVFVTQSANLREPIAHTKTRGERSGSGRKPWKQKGTGRARVGSVRTPIWRKGGVAFGPTNERNFKGKVNKKMNRKAISMVLSGKLRDGEIAIVDRLFFNSKKTKEAAKVIEKFGFVGKVLWAFRPEEKEAMICSRNLATSHNVLADDLSVSMLLNNRYLLISKEAVLKLQQRLIV